MSRTTGKNAARSALTRRIMVQYLLALAGFCVVYVLFIFVAWQIYSGINWNTYDLIYRLVQFAKDYVLLFLGIPALLGWAFITYRFMAKPLRYLDEVVAASAQLAAPDGAPIILPDVMKQIQDELNAVRERALQNARLAREAEQRKNDLIVYLAHDLKTPLTSVIGYLNLLQDEPQISPELRARYTGIALDKAERLEDLINEFFDITRFNLTSLTLEKERTNLSRMLAQIVSEFQPILAEKELTWHTELASDVELLCDPDKMERVFDNLIRNAVSYSYPQTEIFLSMRVENGTAEITVKNNGKTIPPEKLEKIFEQFYRIDSSRSSKTGGAGLGLAIAKEIVDLHGGTIVAESAQESIIFTVRLPGARQKIV